MNGKEKPLDLTVYMGIFLWYTGIKEYHAEASGLYLPMVEEDVDLI